MARRRRLVVEPGCRLHLVSEDDLLHFVEHSDCRVVDVDRDVDPDLFQSGYPVGQSGYRWLGPDYPEGVISSSPGQARRRPGYKVIRELNPEGVLQEPQACRSPERR